MFKLLFVLFSFLILKSTCLPVQIYNSDIYPYSYHLPPSYAIHNVHRHPDYDEIYEGIPEHYVYQQEDSSSAEHISGHNLHDILSQRGDDLVEKQQDYLGEIYLKSVQWTQLHSNVRKIEIV